MLVSFATSTLDSFYCWTLLLETTTRRLEPILLVLEIQQNAKQMAKAIVEQVIWQSHVRFVEDLWASNSVSRLAISAWFEISIDYSAGLPPESSNQTESQIDVVLDSWRTSRVAVVCSNHLAVGRWMELVDLNGMA
jgi:hypothetical protein